MRLILASASPRRLALLRGLGMSPTVVPSDVDESPRADEPPDRRVARLAEAKARAVASAAPPIADTLVLGADTEVVIDGAALGKPVDAAAAETMLRHLRGRSHAVCTGVFLLRRDDGRSAGLVETTRVTFRDFDDRTLRAYAAGGEPLGKAGAYAIQGDGAQLVHSIEGSWSNVVGLPLERLPELFAALGADLPQSAG